MKKTFKGLFSVAIIGICALNTTSCSHKKFNVEGQISNAADSMLYFENVGLEGINIIDSVKPVSYTHLTLPRKQPRLQSSIV